MSHTTRRSRFPESELAAFWNVVMDPAGRGLATAMADDIASFTGESSEHVLARMERGNEEFSELWTATAVDVGDPRSVEGFYADQFVEAYELANWHAGRTSGSPPLNYARAALLARERHLRRVLDFGSGIGSGALCLSAAGCDVHAADVAKRLLSFTRHRFASRQVDLVAIDLASGERPRYQYYDLITCFDVLEHIPDQRSKLNELASYLRVGGLLCVNLMNDSTNPDRPMHISSAGNWLKLVRSTALLPEWSAFDGEMQVLVRRPTARLRNLVGSLVDRVRPPATPVPRSNRPE